MPNFKKSNRGYMMQPKGMGQQGYSMMVNPKKKSVKPPKPFSGKSNFGEIRPASSKATLISLIAEVTSSSVKIPLPKSPSKVFRILSDKLLNIIDNTVKLLHNKQNLL